MERKIELNKSRQVLTGAGNIPLWVWLAFAAYGVILVCFLQNFASWKSLNVLLGLIALPLVTRVKGLNGVDYRYGICAFVCALLTFFAPANTLLYWAVVFALLFVIEAGIGKLNGMPLLIALLMSPIVRYAADVFSFPIRLQLTRLVGNAMQLAGMDITVHGNMIMHNDNEFAVDQACMGLNMLITSLIIGVMMLAICQQRFNKTLGNRWLIPVMLITLVLNLGSNVVRMICLVAFNILPENPMHDWIGILCLIAYVLLPSIWLMGWLVKRYGSERSVAMPVEISARLSSPFMLLVQLALLITVFFAATVVRKEKAALPDDSSPVPAVAGFTASRFDAGIIKLQSQQSLVYIKHIPGFYSAEHNPMICWRGSGYAFRKIEKKKIAGHDVYTALLDNGSHQLYTAWWYDNGQRSTIDQLSWRWDNLKGSHDYSLLNVTAASTSDMMAAVTNILNQKPFNHILSGM
ncbi:exosortase N [Pseudoflavitalea sp. G-6-1-2]|uniref:exosortase N n=1 Tax=Pseudoflavitalea sp. G-6-1-2 TaxID=2728841 RepID=UPI00146F7963|nr:exosortase N [Pseudoflavitalea sp. G-6-1-2]NML20480.1 exosortase N [Pseudoflavitalea sp. G-6-1-2]